jgi:hypothetical protein
MKSEDEHTVIMVNRFNGFAAGFNVLILECFGSGINVSINTEFVHDKVIIFSSK